MIYHRFVQKQSGSVVGYSELVLSHNPLVYYKLDDYQSGVSNSNDLVTDSSGNSRNMQVDNASTTLFGHSSLVSDGGTCVHFNDDNEIGFIGANSWVPTGTAERTIEFWANPEDEGPILYYGSTNSNGRLVDLRIKSITLEKYLVFNGQGCEFRYGPIPSGTVHVCFIIPALSTNCSDAISIINGTQYSGTLHSGSDQGLDTVSSDFKLGRTASVVDEYKGYIDNVAVYDYALSLMRSRSHYNAGL